MTDRFPPLRYRQIHLDFHTSEAIPAVGADFDARDFAGTLSAAHVNSVTLFARCHHGWAYYPSEVGPAHPNLARADLLGDMIDACRTRNIETPVYITVQWNEHLARTRPEWRVMGAANRLKVPNAADRSTGGQLSATWHSLCLVNDGLFEYVRDNALEVVGRYAPPGLFLDIVTGFDCVCPKCLETMREMDLDPEDPEHRARKDQALAASFRERLSAAVWERHPRLRMFYNAGHIPKRNPTRFAPYSHFELESLPTGGWGYDHFPASARFTRTLGVDTLGQTGKFHTMWGEFGGYKSADALIYECAQMVALGTKCEIGDQLHPSGAINADTYARIAPAYERVKALEPFLEGARQISDVAILPAEFFAPAGSARHNRSDDGAVQMLLELQIPFDIVTAHTDFDGYRLLILPDDVPICGDLGCKLKSYVAQGGHLLASGRAGLSPEGGFGIDLGVEDHGEIAFEPSYLTPNGNALGPNVPRNASVMYGNARAVQATGAEVLADIRAPYFQRSWRHFSSHQHTPDDPNAAALATAVAVQGSTAYVAYPIFEMYKRIGQPIYKHIVEALIDRLMPHRSLYTSLPSGGRASLARQAQKERHVLHLLYGGPQVRGVAVDDLQHGVRPIEIIEDVPHLGPVQAEVALEQRPSRVFDALTGTDIDWSWRDGVATVRVDGLHIHRAIVLDGTGAAPNDGEPG